MNIRALLGLPLNLVTLLTRRIASPLAPALSSGIAYRSATTMSIDSSKMSGTSQFPLWSDELTS
jgi:hypothetical protein